MAETSRAALLARITEIAQRATAREGLELWDVELLGTGRSRVLRIYIDKPEGATLDDCELISQQVGTVLDVEDVMPGAQYHLEVSTPGLERRLLKLDHFMRFAGRKAHVALKEPVDGRRNWDGVIAAVEGDEVLFEPTQGEPMRLHMAQIDKANLKFEW
jgi:ribosome maturation factor RimP